MLVFLRSCIVVFFATKCFAGPMSTEDLKDFDKNVRIRLAVLVAKNLETLTQQITSANDGCLLKINTTIDSCASCPAGSASQSKIDEVVKAISYPIVEGEKLVTKITDSLSNVNVREFLGDKLSPVLNTLKGTLGVLINSNEIQNIGKFFSNFESTFNNLKNSLSSIPSSLGKTFETLVGDIGGKLSKLKFWRKRRSACSDCEKLSSKDPNTVITNVCGANVAKQLTDLTKSLENLQELYEDSVNGTVVTELVIGDPQMTYSPSFKVVADLQSLTYNIGATKKTLQGFAGEIINFTDKPTSYDFLADKIYQDFV